jgi:hypothetical protein
VRYIYSSITEGFSNDGDANLLGLLAPHVLLAHLLLLLRRKVVLDVERLPNLLRRLALDHVGDSLADKVQKTLDVEVVGGEGEFEEGRLLNLSERERERREKSNKNKCLYGLSTDCPRTDCSTTLGFAFCRLAREHETRGCEVRGRVFCYLHEVKVPGIDVVRTLRVATLVALRRRRVVLVVRAPLNHLQRRTHTHTHTLRKENVPPTKATQTQPVIRRKLNKEEERTDTLCRGYVAMLWSAEYQAPAHQHQCRPSCCALRTWGRVKRHSKEEETKTGAKQDNFFHAASNCSNSSQLRQSCWVLCETRSNVSSSLLAVYHCGGGQADTDRQHAHTHTRNNKVCPRTPSPVVDMRAIFSVTSTT